MTAERSTPAPSRIADAAADQLAREIADLIMHRIAHCGDGIQVYADLVDARAVAVRAAQHLYDEASDALLSLRTHHPKPLPLSVLLSAQVGSISERSVQARWRSAERLRTEADEAERAYATAMEAERRAQRAAAERVRAEVVRHDAAGLLRMVAEPVRRDAALIEPAGNRLAEDGAEAA